MAYVDKTLELSDGQAVTADAASTNIIDMTAAGLNSGIGEPLYLAVTVQVAPDATTGDETYQVTLQGDDNTGFSSPNTLASFPIPRTAKVGDVFFAPLPSTNERYIRAFYDVGGTTPTITLNAFITNQEPGVWVAREAFTGV